MIFRRIIIAIKKVKTDNQFKSFSTSFLGFGLLGFSIYILISLLSYNAADSGFYYQTNYPVILNLGGPLGAVTSDFLLSTIGIGSGQTSRVDSCKIAINKMRDLGKSSNSKIYAASDAFFPFIDGLEKLVHAGISAVIQPSGSISDKEIIKFANKLGIALVFSNSRHFKH